MKALQFRVTRWLRSRRRVVVMLTIVVAAIATVVLALAGGARRTSTAPDRYTAAFGEHSEETAMQDSGRPRTAEVAALPGANSVEAMSFVFGGIGHLDTGELFDTLVFAGSYRAAGDRLVAGREPDPTRAGEFVATESVAESNGLSIGDAVQLLTLTQADADTHGFDPAHANGPVVDAMLVGVFTGASEFDDPSGVVVFSPALIEDEEIGVSGTVMAIDLEDGVSVDEFGAQIDTLPAAEQLTYGRRQIVSSETRTAVRGQSVGLWLLAGLGAVAAVAALGQVLSRSVRLGPDEVRDLEALGYSQAQLIGEAIGRAAVPVLAGVTTAVGVAVGMSGLFPFGFARDFEPDPGVRFEAVTLLLGSLVLVGALAVWVALTSRVSRAAVSSRPAVINTFASRCPSPAMATGVRFALSSPGRGPAVALGVAGAALVVAALVGTLTFAVSMRRLVDEPARYGANYDVAIDNGADRVPPEVVDLLEGDPDVDAVTLYTATQARVAGATIALVGMEPVRGDLGPVLLTGRLPATAREAMIGRRSARELHLSVGDEISLANDTGTFTYVLTGLAVPPTLRGNDIVGHGAIVTHEGLARVEPTAAPNAVAIRLRKGSDAGTAQRMAEAAGIAGAEDEPMNRPPAILNVARITFVPFALAGLLAALAALVVVNVLYTGVRRRDGQMAVLRSLGADRRWLVRAMSWQAIASTLVPAVIGAPIGVVAGRLAFIAFADHLATVNDALLPVRLAGTAIAALVVLGITVATVAGRPARRIAPAELLRAAG